MAFRLDMMSLRVSSSLSVRAGYGMWKCSVVDWISYGAPVTPGKVWPGSCAAGDNSLSASVDKRERERERDSTNW